MGGPGTETGRFPSVSVPSPVMLHRPRALLLALLLAAGCAGPGPERPFAVELEAGPVWQSRNDVAVPGDGGTRLTLDELTGSGPFAGGRVYLGWSPAERHELRVLVAPFSASGSGELAGPVSFAGRDFDPGPARAEYRFDSYRLTYRYRSLERARWNGHVGLTAKVRDAEISLSQGGESARKTDTGVVPLLHLAADYMPCPQWRLALDLDGSWAPQGRALDASLKGYRRLGDGWELGLGYRTIEGGADNDEVYTFAWIHQAVISLRAAF